MGISRPKVKDKAVSVTLPSVFRCLAETGRESGGCGEGEAPTTGLVCCRERLGHLPAHKVSPHSRKSGWRFNMSDLRKYQRKSQVDRREPSKEPFKL